MFCDVITRLAVSISFDEFQDASAENGILVGVCVCVLACRRLASTGGASII